MGMRAGDDVGVQAEELDLVGQGPYGRLEFANDGLQTQNKNTKLMSLYSYRNRKRRLTSWPLNASLCQAMTSFLRFNISACISCVSSWCMFADCWVYAGMSVFVIASLTWRSMIGVTALDTVRAK